jgi:hypothetical protein
MKHQSHLFVTLSQDLALLGALSEAVGGEAHVLRAGSYQELIELATQPNVRGLIVDALALSGDARASGREQSIVQRLSRLRGEAPLARVLFVAAELPALLLNDLQPLRVDIVARPLPAQALSMFVERSLSAGRLKTKSVAAYIDQLASAHRLNGKEVSLFSVVLDNETPQQACARLGLDEVVFSRTMRRLLKKCHMRSADRLAKSVMRDALLSASSLTASLIEPLSSQSAAL